MRCRGHRGPWLFPVGAIFYSPPPDVSNCPRVLTPVPLGTSALLLSENRLEAPLAKIAQLLIQKLVLSCGDDREKGPGPGLRLFQEKYCL